MNRLGKTFDSFGQVFLIRFPSLHSGLGSDLGLGSGLGSRLRFGSGSGSELGVWSGPPLLEFFLGSSGSLDTSLMWLQRAVA